MPDTVYLFPWVWVDYTAPTGFDEDAFNCWGTAPIPLTRTGPQEWQGSSGNGVDFILTTDVGGTAKTCGYPEYGSNWCPLVLRYRCQPTADWRYTQAGCPVADAPGPDPHSGHCYNCQPQSTWEGVESWIDPNRLYMQPCCPGLPGNDTYSRVNLVWILTTTPPRLAHDCCCFGAFDIFTPLTISIGVTGYFTSNFSGPFELFARGVWYFVGSTGEMYQPFSIKLRCIADVVETVYRFFEISDLYSPDEGAGGIYILDMVEDTTVLHSCNPFLVEYNAKGRVIDDGIEQPGTPCDVRITVSE
jgi:hypothetical protein